MSEPKEWRVCVSGKDIGDTLSAEEVLARLDQGEFREDDLCRCPGMSDWRPLRQIEPFARAIRDKKRKRRQLVILTFSFLVPAVLVTAGAMVAIWLRRNAPPRLEVTAAVGQPSVREGLLAEPASEADVQLSVRNRSPRPIALAGAELADEHIGKPGPPDVTLSLVRGGSVPSGSAGESRPVALRFGDSPVAGCVLRPDEAVTIEARFTPIWDARRIQRPSQAGKWSARFQAADRQKVASIDFEIPAVTHPQDRRINEVLDRLDAARRQLDAGLAELRSGAAATSGLERITRLLDSLGACQASVEELKQLGAPPPKDAETSLAAPTEQLQELAAGMRGFLADLDQSQIEPALEKLARLRESPAAQDEVGAALIGTLPPLILERARELSGSGRPAQVVLLLGSLDPSLMSQPELGRQAAALLAKAIPETLQVAGIRAIGPDGGLRPDSSGPSDGQAQPPSDRCLDQAIRQAVGWDSSLEKSDDLAYALLMAKKLGGRLAEADVAAFAQAHPSFRRDEFSCWFGVQSLWGDDPKAASEKFNVVAQSEPKSEYLPLAQLGLAIAALRATEDDVVARVTAQREACQWLSQRQGWSPDLLRLLPAEAAADPKSADWILGLSIVRTPDELSVWLRGPKETIPWLVPRGQEIPADLLGELRKEFTSGAVAFANAAAFNNLTTTLRCEPADPKPASGVAHPVLTWGSRRLSYPFLQGIQGVRYDTGESPALVPVRLVTSAGSEVRPFLQADANWFACVARLFRVKGRSDASRGAVIFLPERINDTPDGHRFLKGLVEFSLEAAARNRK